MIGAGVYKKHGCRVTEFTICSMCALALENDKVRVTVLLDKGADIVEFRDKATDIDVLWGMPSGLRAPFSTMPTQYSEAGNYLDFYEGGWQELFQSIGDPASVRGASLGVHGEACMLPWTWRLIEESDKCISVELRAYMLRTPFELTKRLTLRSGTRMLSICERAQNHGQVAMPLCWGHHPALGGPVLEGEVYVDIPARRGFTYDISFHPDFPAARKFEWPHVTAELDVSCMPALNGRWAGICCATELTEGWCALTNPGLELGFALAFDMQLFAYVWLWMVYEGMEHYPWYGRTRCLAIEPYSSVPDNLEKAIAQNTALWLGPGECMETEMCAMLYTSKARIAHVDLRGNIISKGGDNIC